MVPNRKRFHGLFILSTKWLRAEQGTKESPRLSGCCDLWQPLSYRCQGAVCVTTHSKSSAVLDMRAKAETPQNTLPLTHTCLHIAMIFKLAGSSSCPLMPPKSSQAFHFNPYCVTMCTLTHPPST